MYKRDTSADWGTRSVKRKRPLIDLTRLGHESGAELKTMVLELCDVVPPRPDDDANGVHWSNRFAASGKQTCMRSAPRIRMS